jgi:hypothetical protein
MEFIFDRYWRQQICLEEQDPQLSAMRELRGRDAGVRACA